MLRVYSCPKEQLSKTKSKLMEGLAFGQTDTQHILSERITDYNYDIIEGIYVIYQSGMLSLLVT